MEKDLVDIVMEKNYIELSANEKAELSEFCSSESEYNQLKDVFHGVEQMQFEAFTPKKETKESLNSLFDDTHPKAAPIWYMSILAVVVPKEKSIHRQPLMQIAAVGLLFFLAFPFFQTELTENSPQLAKNEQATPELENDVKLTETPKEIDNTNDVVETIAEVKTEISVDLIVGNATAPVLAGAVITREVTDPGSTHPDGIFNEGLEIAYSQPASAEPDMLDLLTATF